MNRHLLARGVTMRPDGGRVRVNYGEFEARIRARLAAGETIAGIARAYHLSYVPLYKWLRRAGIRR